uniref:Putative secreted protein n=1 Tax=Xenopsylla cheopis TaxID=163159 RepID=A0A6M2E400_XENCH
MMVITSLDLGIVPCPIVLIIASVFSLVGSSTVRRSPKLLHHISAPLSCHVGFVQYSYQYMHENQSPIHGFRKESCPGSID